MRSFFDFVTDLWYDFGYVVIVVGVIFAVIFGAFWMTRRSCLEYQEVTGRDVEWRIVSGCYAQADDGRWYPADRIWDEGTPR